MQRVFVLQHFPSETLGTIAATLQSRGIAASHIQTFVSQTVPRELGDAAGLIVMGGPMSVYEEERYPHLRDELRLIERALREDKPVLGVCLGSQLLAAALGTPVSKGSQKEIGWHSVTLSVDGKADALWHKVVSPFVGFHWHGDVFALPQGAISLASSALTNCQAFRYGRSAYGLLFHMEVTGAMVAEMVASFAAEACEAGVAGSDIIAAASQHLPALHCIGSQIFGRWADMVEAGEEPG